MSKQLKILYGGVEIFDGEVGPFSWSETAGGITVTAAPPGAPPVEAPRSVGVRGSGLGGGLAKAATPALQKLAADLKEKSKASAEKARAAAEGQEAAEKAADE